MIDHRTYLKLLARITRSLPNPSKHDVKKVRHHIVSWQACPECCHESETEEFLAEERDFRHRISQLMTVRERFRSISPIVMIDAHIEGKTMQKRWREADRVASWHMAEMWARMDEEEAEAEREEELKKLN
jgi:hypothetical protein